MIYIPILKIKILIQIHKTNTKYLNVNKYDLTEKSTYLEEVGAYKTNTQIVFILISL